MATTSIQHRIPRSHEPMRCSYSLSFIILLPLILSVPSECFSTAPQTKNSNINLIKSIIIDHACATKSDATTTPLERILSVSGITPIHDDDTDTGLTSASSTTTTTTKITVSYASDFMPREDIPVSAYNKFTQARHRDCIDLFDGYDSKLMRCEALDETSLNVRWTSSWIPPGSTWLYNLADMAGWSVTRKSPDPAVIASFSWKSVFGMFQKAIATGNITLPISSVEGNTIITVVEESLVEDNSSSSSVGGKCIKVSLKESIDLVSEADKSRLQNRKVAQELASWIDVSRRPPDYDMNLDEWAGIVRQRILTGVAGAGPLDVDPNEDDSEGVIALLIFSLISVGFLAFSFEYFIVPEIVGGTGVYNTDQMM